ncbi:hypothetical protein [Mycoavidus sp. SF9855]|uniref:hypothetical protein n=1 Tax=Mycoavidus sp. SF9855 TaxID=2968475 RepID=UPI00211CF69A|nr:hypothetical protein [Mycoavidus sp. SF9855]UUM20955.1 hypothetical protein NQD60_05585 [Mycoavidus sp. SF9855]
MSMYHVPCVITIDLNRYLAQLDKENLWQEAINSKQEKLLADGSDCYPFLTDNLSEAICEINIETIAALLKAGNYEEAGKALADLVNVYWEREAQRKAEREIENERANACPRSLDQGCRHFDENYRRSYG